MEKKMEYICKQCVTKDTFSIFPCVLTIKLKVGEDVGIIQMPPDRCPYGQDHKVKWEIRLSEIKKESEKE